MLVFVNEVVGAFACLCSWLCICGCGWVLRLCECAYVCGLVCVLFCGVFACGCVCVFVPSWAFCVLGGCVCDCVYGRVVCVCLCLCQVS